MANLNTNVTTANSHPNDLSPTFQTFYDRKLLKDMMPSLVHAQFGQKRPIPKNNGKTINFRKWTQFDERLTALTEGVTPDGQSMDMTSMTATVAQYGGYVVVSDLLDMAALDPVIAAAVEQMAWQGAKTIDTVTRDVMAAGTNVLYAAGNERASVPATAVLSSTLIRKAVRTLKKQNAPMFTTGGRAHYIGIVGPDTVFDLQNDAAWLDVSKYQDKNNIYYGEIGTLFGVRFVETTQAKVFSANAHILDEGTNINETDTLTTITSDAYVINGSTYTLQVTATATTLGSAGIAALVGKEIVVNGKKAKITAAAAHSTAANGTILTLDTKLSETTEDSALNSVTVYPAGGGKTGNDVAATLIFGRDAYGTIDIAGSGAVKTIVKNMGSAGTDDPLNQRASVGWKAAAYTAAILNDEWLVRVEHGMTDR